MAGTTNRPVYRFQRGEPIVIGRQVLSGDPTGYTVSAKLKPTDSANIPAESVAAAATFLVEFLPAAGGDPARWLLSIPAVQAALLLEGRYVTDAKFMRDGEPVMITEPAFIEIAPSVSG